jgi:hypothetical protein
MKITHKIDIYLDDYRPTPEIVVMQCDANTRELQFSLYAANQPWQAPDEAKLYVSYRKPDGTGGFYDTLPDGTWACIAGEGNTVTAILAEQILTVPGKVPVAISIQLDGAVLATFSVQLRVMPNPGIGAMKSENYFCLKAAVDAAVVAAQKPVRIITVFSSGDGKYATDHDMSMIKAMIDSNTPFVCYWYDKNIMLHLTGFQTDVAFEFTAVDDIKEYRVVITKDGVNTYVTDLAKMSDIPQKVSQLENDSGFLTDAPVKSVNGQTGEVKLPTVVKVPLIRQEDGTYKPGISHEDILAAYHAGNFVFCEYSGRLLPLIVASEAICSFGCVHSGKVYAVNITRASAVASIVPLTSGDSGSALADAVLHTPQDLTPEQQAQARLNIGVSQKQEVEVVLNDVGASLVDASVKTVFDSIDAGNTVVLYRNIEDGTRVYYNFRERKEDAGGGESLTFTYRSTVVIDDIILHRGGFFNGSIGHGTENLTADTVGAVPAPMTAEIGQAMCVTEVDENGKPTQWEATDLAGGGNANICNITVKTEQEVKGIKLELPATLSKFYIVKFIIDFADGLTEAAHLFFQQAGAFHSFAATLSINTRQVVVFGLHRSDTELDARMTSDTIAAYPGMPMGSINISNTDKTITISLYETDVYFPAGSSISVWGVYEK